MNVPPMVEGPRALRTLRFGLRPTAFLDAAYERHGDFFRTTTPLERNLCITADPQVINQVFRGDPNLLHAGEGNSVLGPLVGSSSVLLLDGAEHLRHRKMMLPPFHGERMREYGQMMQQVAEREVARWPDGEAFSVLGSTQRITLEIIMRAVFGIDEAARLEQVGRRLRATMDPMSDRVRLMVLMLAPSSWGPRSPWGRFRERVRAADELIYEEIRARRADPAAAERGDIMSLLLQAHDEDGNPLSDKEMRDELVTLLVAGHETTATSLAWTLERLVRHPDVLSRLVEEHEAGEGEYLDAVIKETLRLRPVIPAVIRRLKAPMEFGGYELPEGWFIVPSIYLTHRRPEVFPQPLEFRPERFIDSPPKNYEWFPFGGGVRRCLGASFAQYEMKVVLGEVLRARRLRAPSGAPEVIRRRSITFAPSQGGRIVAARRVSAPVSREVAGAAA